MQRLVVIYGGRTIGVSELPAKYAPSRPVLASPLDLTMTAAFEIGPEGIDFDAVIHELEEKLIRKALELTSGNKKDAARLLHLNRTTLLEKIKKKGLDLP